MPEFFQELGDTLGGLWAFFQDEDGSLTVLGGLLLAGLALGTAFRCVLALRPALGDKRLTSVVGVGAAIASVFGSVGLYFLYVTITAGG